MTTPRRPALCCRARAILRAVAQGRVQTSLSTEPDLLIDGLACCDQFTAHGLAHAGLLRPKLLPAGGPVRVHAPGVEVGGAEADDVPHKALIDELLRSEGWGVEAILQGHLADGPVRRQSPPHAGREYTYAPHRVALTQAEVAWGQNPGGVMIYAR